MQFIKPEPVCKAWRPLAAASVIPASMWDRRRAFAGGSARWVGGKQKGLWGDAASNKEACSPGSLAAGVCVKGPSSAIGSYWRDWTFGLASPTGRLLGLVIPGQEGRTMSVALVWGRQLPPYWPAYQGLWGPQPQLACQLVSALPCLTKQYGWPLS